MQFKPKNDLPLMDESEGVVLFYPHIPEQAIQEVANTLRSRWIGQGPRVELFESQFKSRFNIQGAAIATGSGTDSLHLAYLLADIKPGDEVLVPLFTCTATNIPLLYIGAKLVFVDVDPQTLNVSVSDLKAKISERTKAIVVVHFGGLPCDMQEIHDLARENNCVVIEDAAHAIGSQYDGKYIGDISDFTMFSFQAIKQITTGDGGMLCMRDSSLSPKAERLRWFGIDRSQKQMGIWENDIRDIGYKYQMTDIAASIGLVSLAQYPMTLGYRQFLAARYNDKLRNLSGLQIINDFSPRKVHSYWLYSVNVENRKNCQAMLRSHGIESGQTHYRNDRYSIFSDFTTDPSEFPGMNKVDDTYLILPLHTKVTEQDVDKICNLLRSGW